MKKRILLLALGFCLILPSIGAATGSVPNTKKSPEMNCPDDCDHAKHEQMHKQWQEKMREREQQIMSWVNQFTPEKKAEWEQVLQERKALHEKWLSPEFAQKREKWKQEKIAKIEELKKLYDQGKITKEELLKQAHGGKDVAHWKTYHELKTAVENKNEPQIKQLLNQMLDQHKQHNEKLGELMKK